MSAEPSFEFRLQQGLLLDIERQLADGAPFVTIYSQRVSRAAAWLAVEAIRHAHGRGLLWDGRPPPKEEP